MNLCLNCQKICPSNNIGIINKNQPGRKIVGSVRLASNVALKKHPYLK
ncbi:MAG: hypothetical protein PHQ17_02070 [Methanobacterium sp.]|nr:hypothetical protein [Methanobacterium sp.]